MSKFIFFIAVLLDLSVWGAACCGGGGPKSFLALQELQNFDFSLVSSFQESYGWHNARGEAFSRKGPIDITLQASTVGRLSPNWEAFGRFPIIYRTTDYGAITQSRSSLGDITLGLRWTLLRSLFVEDPFPTVSLVLGSKLPTGLSEIKENGVFKPGTGNGMWEPLVGLSFRKDYFGWLGNIDATWSPQIGGSKGRSERENQLSLTESLSYAFSRRFNWGLGSSQTWGFEKEMEGHIIPGSASRGLAVFTSANYFISQFTSVGAGVECSVPWDGFGINQPITRTASLNVRYGFY
ncbi:MAG: hypothetical protein EBQ85_08015 [Proteobacteria bacterium]|nr:hypothetical protein [Pseudomonadota bacterium]